MIFISFLKCLLLSEFHCIIMINFMLQVVIDAKIGMGQNF